MKLGAAKPTEDAKILLHKLKLTSTSGLQTKSKEQQDRGKLHRWVQMQGHC